MNEFLTHFPDFDTATLEQLNKLQPLYADWNQKINVVSRQDIDNLFERHIMHSLMIAKIIRFTTGSEILDVGTGGGFPGIPLAIVFPHVHFHLVDSIGKKITVVKNIAEALQLKNLTAEQLRIEEHKKKYDFITGRAITELPKFVEWVKKNISTTQRNAIPNGILYLKGGDVEAEAKACKMKFNMHDLHHYFPTEFYETKKLIHLVL